MIQQARGASRPRHSSCSHLLKMRRTFHTCDGGYPHRLATQINASDDADDEGSSGGPGTCPCDARGSFNEKTSSQQAAGKQAGTSVSAGIIIVNSFPRLAAGRCPLRARRAAAAEDVDVDVDVGQSRCCSLLECMCGVL